MAVALSFVGLPYWRLQLSVAPASLNWEKEGTLIEYPKQLDPYYKDPRIRYP